MLRNWKLPRYLEDIRWFPEGKKLAVLYSGGFDEKTNFVGAEPGFKLSGILDVKVFDAESGRSLLRFFIGDLEAKISFSPDGSLIYSVCLSPYA